MYIPPQKRLLHQNKKRKKRGKPYWVLFIPILLVVGYSFQINAFSLPSELTTNLQSNLLPTSSNPNTLAEMETEINKKNELEIETNNKIELETKNIITTETNSENIPLSDTYPIPIVVNQSTPLPSTYKPQKLVDIAPSVPSTKNSILLEEEAAQQFILLAEAMKADGISQMVAVSGYRDYDYQKKLFDAQVERNTKKGLSLSKALEVSATVVAPPGSSEHQSGLAIDVSSTTVNHSLSASFENTEVYSWLDKNAHLFGFVVRYKQDKTEITGIVFEPWHLRYVGTKHATALVEQSLCLEEYVDLLYR